MICFLVILLWPHLCCADIFERSPDVDERLNEAIHLDARGLYYKGGIDYSVYEGPRRYERRDREGFVKDKVPSGIRQFDLPKSIKESMMDREFSSQYTQSIMDGISRHPLMTYQYSSPAKADLYKHLETMANLRIAMRYQQFEDLERFANDPLDRLRKQAELDCLRSKGNGVDIETAFKSCFSILGGNAPLLELNDPENGRNNIQGTVNLIEKALKRVKHNNDNWDAIEAILPKVNISSSSVVIKPAEKQIRQVFYEQRKELVKELSELVDIYKNNQRFDAEKADQFYVSSAPLTEAQLRNIALLTKTEQYLYITKLASQVAYLKVIDKYSKAFEWLNRAMQHPAIEPGYKGFIKPQAEYVQAQIDEIIDEKARLEWYADSMVRVVDKADEERLKAITQIDR